VKYLIGKPRFCFNCFLTEGIFIIRQDIGYINTDMSD